MHQNIQQQQKRGQSNSHSARYLFQEKKNYNNVTLTILTPKMCFLSTIYSLVTVCKVHSSEDTLYLA